MSAVVAPMAPFSVDLKFDFGFYRRVVVGDFVWLDADADGRQDANELGVGGSQRQPQASAARPTHSKSAQGSSSRSSISSASPLRRRSPTALAAIASTPTTCRRWCRAPP